MGLLVTRKMDLRRFLSSLCHILGETISFHAPRCTEMYQSGNLEDFFDDFPACLANLLQGISFSSRAAFFVRVYSSLYHDEGVITRDNSRDARYYSPNKPPRPNPHNNEHPWPQRTSPHAPRARSAFDPRRLCHWTRATRDRAVPVACSTFRPRRAHRLRLARRAAARQ